MSLLEHLDTQFYRKIQTRVETIHETPSDWIEKYFYVNDPRDPVTGEFLSPGPIVLADHQRRLIDEALSFNEYGKRKYTTVIYSAPKKSGKSALASAVTLYMAYSRPSSFVYCLANDGKQSSDRIYGPIKECLRLHRDKKGPFKDENPNLGNVILSNNTKIEAITVDARGEAGSQPLFTCFSEIWGYDTEGKKRLWSEMTPPPTLFGYAMRWVESYAGFVGVSDILEQLYETAVKGGTPHPDFGDLINSDGTPTVYVNEAAGIFCYWDHEPRMLWQTPEYYAEQSLTLSSSEFDRIHRNMWVSAISSFIDASQWEVLKKDLGPIRGNTPVVLGVDGAISNDHAAIVGVTRDPDNNDDVSIRFVYIFEPAKSGGIIKISETVEPKIRELCETYNVVCCAYDKYQLEDMAQRLRKNNVVWMYDFSQQTERAISDKELYDSIINKTIWWDLHGDNLNKNGDLETLYKHITQAGAKTDGGKLRLEKLSDKAKIDAAVATSMARKKCKQLSIGNKEKDLGQSIRSHTRGQMTDEEFLKQVRNRHATNGHERL